MTKKGSCLSNQTIATNYLIGVVIAFILIMFKKQTIIGLNGEDYVAILLIGTFISVVISIIEVAKQ